MGIMKPFCQLKRVNDRNSENILPNNFNGERKFKNAKSE
jgi:hypothetical protein